MKYHIRDQHPNFGEPENLWCFGTGDGGTGEGGGGGPEPAASAVPPAGDTVSADIVEPEPSPTPDAVVRDPANPSAEWMREIQAKGKGAKLTKDEIAATMNFKPPKPDPKAPKPEPKPDSKTAAKPDPKAAPKATTPKKTPAEPDLAKTVAAAVKTTLEQTGVTPPKGGNQPQPQPQAPRDFYHVEDKDNQPLHIPDEIMQGMDSDDPKVRHAAANAIATGVANVVMRDVLQKVLPVFGAHMTQQIMGQYQAQSGAESASAAFYSRHPQLNNKIFTPMVEQVGRALAQQWRAEGREFQNGNRLSDEFMDAIADEIKAQAVAAGFNFGASPAPAAVVQPPPAAPQPRPATPFMTGKSSVRPPAATQAQRKSEEILDIVRG